ncbi:MAG: ACT domain-containing protein [Candidatus Micrarchaeia archaeon]
MPEKDAGKLVKGMHPSASTEKYYFALVGEGQMMALAGYLQYVFCVCREPEGLSAVVNEIGKDGIESISLEKAQGPFSLVSVGVESDLMAVGFLAKITSALAKEGISANAVSAYKRDYLLVPYEKREQALKALAKLSVK